MHTRSRTWPLNSDPVQRCRDRTGLIDSPDGSTLSLDFTTGILDPRLAFTRGTNATFINSSGLVEWAAANFITQSNNFAVSPWSSLNVTMSIDGSSPVGDAWKMLENNVSSLHRLDLTTFSYGNNGLSMTFSVYVKQGSGSRQAYFTVSDNATGDIRSKRLNPVTGLLEGSESVSGSWTNVSTSVQSVGGGWYRLVFTATKNAGAAVICRTGMSDSSGNLSYAGDGTSFLYFAGCQMNPGTSAQAYNATTGSAYTAPRFDYDPTSIGTPRGLLIEGSANNLARYSDTLETTGGFWSGNIANRTPETSDVNPTGSTGSMSFAPASNGPSRYWGLFLTGQTTTVAYTYSVWVKAKGTSSLVVSIQNSAGAVNSNARIISQPSGANASFTGSGGGFPQINNLSATGWTRIELTTTGNLGGTGGLNVFMYPKDTSAQTTTDSVFAWGAQLEAGTGASSYIPTGASTGNRGQDLVSITSTDFSSWWLSSNPLSMWFDIAATGRALTNGVFRVADASGSAYGYQAYWFGTSFPIQLRATISGPVNSDISLGTVAANTRTKFAYTINSAAVKRFKDGSLVNTVSTPTLPPDPMSRFYFGGNPAFGGASGDFHLRGFKYWPIVLSDSQVISLTT